MGSIYAYFTIFESVNAHNEETNKVSFFVVTLRSGRGQVAGRSREWTHIFLKLCAIFCGKIHFYLRMCNFCSTFVA